MRTKKYKKKHRKSKKAGTRGRLNNVDVVLHKVDKILNQYSQENTKNLRELVDKMNQNINGYLLKEAAERRHVIIEIEKLENIYSTPREDSHSTSKE
tara:strand:- start:4093 stop:4383 length:291 start_codon:yes stop_codon:yes gene_type:complete